MVQESNSGRNVDHLFDICAGNTIQINENLNFRFTSFARNGCLTSGHEWSRREGKWQN